MKQHRHIHQKGIFTLFYLIQQSFNSIILAYKMLNFSYVFIVSSPKTQIGQKNSNENTHVPAFFNQLKLIDAIIVNAALYVFVVLNCHLETICSYTFHPLTYIEYNRRTKTAAVLNVFPHKIPTYEQGCVIRSEETVTM